MCASFTFKLNKESLINFFESMSFDIDLNEENLFLDIYPFKKALVIVKKSSCVHLTTMRYSLTPVWSKEEKVKWATYNARMNRFNEKLKKKEFIYEVPTWKTAFAKYHCIVPINSFRESCHEGKAKGYIVDFKPTRSEILFIAGIYEEWVNKSTGEIIPTFAIVTTEPDQYIKDVGHDRSPVILKEDSAKRWLEPFSSPQDAYKFLDEKKHIPNLEFSHFRRLKSV